MNRVELAPGVYWVGVVDWDLREFHGYSTHKGSTYNAYLIVDDKIALVDTVKSPFAAEMLERIQELVDPASIDYVIANHIELDHSGSLPVVMARAPKAQVITSQRFGEQALARHFYADWPIIPVKDGSDLDLGHRKLRFHPIPMLHWPDSMCTYSPEDRILFSNDAFGQHIAVSPIFDDETDLEAVMNEATKYYATILMPFGDLILKAVARLGALDIKTIAPSHGAIWRSHPDLILEAYGRWGRAEADPRALVVNDTMWGSTDKMARALVEGITSRGVRAGLYNLTQTDRSDVIKEVLESRALLVGSSTLNNGVLPTVAAFLSNLKGLRPRGKVGLAFGSYGWAGGAVKEVHQELESAGVELVAEDLAVKYVPTAEDLARCFEVGATVAERIRALSAAESARAVRNEG